MKIYSTAAHGPIGECRDHSGKVHIYLDATFWPERIRDEKVGLQFIGEFHNFENFKMSGSFEELQLEDTSIPDFDFWGIGY